MLPSELRTKRRLVKAACGAAILATIAIFAVPYIRDRRTPKSPQAPLTDVDIRSYELHASAHFATQTIHATLRIEGQLIDPAVIVLDSAVSQINKVTGGNASDVYEFSIDEKREELRIKTAPGSKVGDSFSISIEYEAKASNALAFYLGQDDDPVTSRVVSTGGEPTEVPQWMPCHNTPADRALFRVEFEVPEGEDAVASGQREPASSAVTTTGRRTIRYSSGHDIPIYTMGFAAGTLQMVTASAGRLPLQLWQRVGAPIDTQGITALMAQLLARFEAMFGPYPFPSLSVVFVPNLPSGAEGASLFFLDEASGEGLLDRNTIAHMFAHQWIGAYATIADWQDLWVKEGLAVVAAGEELTLREERSGDVTPALHGGNFTFDLGDTILDRGLSYGHKPTSLSTTGPYNRAAWLLTQTRALSGDAAFFGAWQNLLHASAWGTISTADVELLLTKLRGDAPIPPWRRLLSADSAPLLRAAATPRGLVYSLSLESAEGLLLSPVTLTTVTKAGIATVTPIKADGEHELASEPGGYIVFDEADTHTANIVPREANEAAASTFASISPLALETLLSRSIAAEATILGAIASTSLTPDLFARLFSRLRSARARAVLLAKSCSAMAENSENAAWVQKLEPALRDAKDIGYRNMSACGSALAERLFGNEVEALVAKRSIADVARLEYLLGFDFGDEGSLRRFGPIAESSPSPRLRALALRRLLRQAEGNHFTAIPETDARRTPWEEFFLRVLARASSPDRIVDAMSGSAALRDTRALKVLSARLQSQDLPDDTQAALICMARFEVDELELTEFFRNLLTAPLGPIAQERTRDLDSCD
jgi:aminopeptidase N